MKSQEGRFAAKMKVQQKNFTLKVEKLEEKFQRKCEEVEEDATKDAAADLKDAEFTGDAGHVNAGSDDIQKGQKIFEAKEAEMSKTQSGNECKIDIAVEEMVLQEGMQGGTAIVAEQTKRGQKITKKKDKKDHKDKHRSERWYPPGYQPKKLNPEQMEIMVHFLTS